MTNKLNKHMNPFISKFEKKSRPELIRILDNPSDYTPEALEAARICLRTIEEEIELAIQDPTQGKTKLRLDENAPEVKAESDYANLNDFLLSLTGENFLTYIILAILFWSIIDVFAMYADESKLLAPFTRVIFLSFSIVGLINHIFFKFENKKRNGFLGRFLSTSILLFAVFVYRVFFEMISIGLYIRLDLSHIISFEYIVQLMFFTLIFESAVSLFNLIISKYKWLQL